MPTAKQRATAAKKAYKSVVSSTGVPYNPRTYIKQTVGAKAARVVGKQIAKSAARPGTHQALIGKPKQRKAAVGPRSQINYTKLANRYSEHASFGEVEGVIRDIQQAYRKNLRKGK